MGCPFHCIAYAHNYSCADWEGLDDHLRDVPCQDIFKLSASAAASEFCEWVQVGIDVYIHHQKYQVKPHSSPWFSAACAAATVHRNHFLDPWQSQQGSYKLGAICPSVCLRQAFSTTSFNFSKTWDEVRVL